MSFVSTALRMVPFVHSDFGLPIGGRPVIDSRLKDMSNLDMIHMLYHALSASFPVSVIGCYRHHDGQGVIVGLKVLHSVCSLTILGFPISISKGFKRGAKMC